MIRISSFVFLTLLILLARVRASDNEPLTIKGSEGWIAAVAFMPDGK
jgi:hypothetical protein